MNNLLENLNPEQLAAVLHKDGPLLIVAGAGTGKTTVISQRLAYLIEQGLAKADEILALTFTEKAAAEMAERTGALLPIGYFDLWIMTFHGLAERILKEHGLAIGLPGDFKLLNEFDQWALIKKNLAEFELDYYRPLGNPAKFIRALLKHFSRAKDEDISSRQYLEYAEGLREDLDGMLSGASKLSLRGANAAKRNERRGNLTDEAARVRLLRPADAGFAMTEKIDKQEVSRLNEVANAYHVYERLLLDNNALDFGDLINYTLKLFRQRPAILEKYRQQFKYILVDEFQDTNWAQYELIKLLAAPAGNLAVLADDDQAIYRFRGASMSNILQYNKDYPEAKKIFLTKNYRSRQNILDLSYEFIKQNNPNRLEWQLESQKISVIPASEPESRVERAGQVSGLRVGARNDKKKNSLQKLSKKLVAENAGAGEIEVIAGADLAEEVNLVADKIAALKKSDKTASWNDFAVLVRANDSANNFMAEFERRGLPFIFGASRGLYLKPVIMDAVAYFKLLDNYHESPALWRILNLPVFNFTDEELMNFNHLAGKKAWSLFEVIKSGAVLKFAPVLMEKIKPVLALIVKHSLLAREKPASEVFLAFMNDSGYLKYLAASGERKNLEAISLLNQFLKRIKTFENSADDKTVKAFLAELNLEAEAGETGGLAAEIDAGPEAIKILTAHGAKGLEFQYVFIVNLVDKRFPTIERGETISLPEPLIKEILPQGDAHLEEERRLFYVAMTRAKSGLYFSWAPDYGGKAKKKPSRFLIECGLVKISSDKSQFSNHKSQTNSNFQITNPKQIQNSEFRIHNSITLPAHFSYSQLAAYSNCPYQYRFAHILKIPTRGKEQFSFGKTLHLVLQKLFVLLNEKKGLGQADLFGAAEKSGNITFEEILKLYEDSWLDDWFESKQKKQERKKQGEQILRVFYEKHKDNWPAAIFLEKGFNFRIADGPDSYVVRGAVDRIDRIGAGLKLVDYKTGQPKDKLLFRDKEQLLIYQLAIQELFKEEVKVLAFYYLENNSEVEFIGSAKDLEKIKVKIIETIREIKQGRFEAKPGLICAWCDFKEICEYRA
ncbi:MAG: UvrD-helicase domain-containing protein [Parcubacteria group bacterium]|nr:UvrD-helicase domain-containing protein [Parcubacteria group bacterium]